MNIVRLYKNTPNKEDREWFLLGLIMLVAMMIMIFITCLQKEGTYNYYYANNGLFISIIMSILLMLGGKEKTKVMFHKIKRLFQKSHDLNLYDYGDILILITYILSIVSFIFILDLSFIKNNGIRISAVVGITIAKLLKDLVWSRFR